MATVNILNLLEKSDSAKCPNCAVVATFNFENEWPYEPPIRKSITSMDQITGLDQAVKKARMKSFSIRTLKCNACNAITVIAYPEGMLHDKGVLVWPIKSSRKLEREELLTPTIKKDFYEAASIEKFSPTASAALSRRCLQQIIKEKYSSLMPKNDKLKIQVNAVLVANVLPDYISSELHSIRSIGNNAAHPNVDPATNEIIEVEEGEASDCLNVLESFI